MVAVFAVTVVLPALSAGLNLSSTTEQEPTSAANPTRLNRAEEFPFPHRIEPGTSSPPAGSEPPWTPYIPFVGRPVPPPPPDEADDLTCEPHEPIRITEDHGAQGFTRTDPETGEREYRPGSGVVAGNGTQENPYVIKDWCIQVPPEGHGIHIENITAHVRIQDNVVSGYYRPIFLLEIITYGIYLEDIHTATVTDNYVTTQAQGIALNGAYENRVEGNTVYRSSYTGILLRNDTRDNTVVNNTVVSSRWDGILSINALRTEITNNTVGDTSWGIITAGAYNSTVRGNVARGNGIGFEIASRRNLVENNTLEENFVHGLSLTWRSKNNIVRDNTVTENGVYGVAVYGRATANSVAENVVTDNGEAGVWVSRYLGNAPAKNGFHRNVIEGNGDVGLLAEDLHHSVNATDNWWGHPSGPSGGVTDACTGTVADGAGAGIEVTNASVCFDPWLDSKP